MGIGSPYRGYLIIPVGIPYGSPYGGYLNIVLWGIPYGLVQR